MHRKSETFQCVANADELRATADELYEYTRDRLVEILPPKSLIEHIGATAVPGCLTKGDLDLVVRVEAPLFAQADRALVSMFDRNAKSVQTESFSAFEDRSANMSVGIQLTTIGGEFDVFHQFADRLRQNPNLVEQYNALKRRFEGKSMEDYRDAKSAFIESVLNAG